MVETLVVLLEVELAGGVLLEELGEYTVGVVVVEEASASVRANAHGEEAELIGGEVRDGE